MSKRTRKLAKAEPVVTLDVQEIEGLAYQRWLERGRPQGSAEEDWLAAESELLARGRSMVRAMSAGGSE